MTIPVRPTFGRLNQHVAVYSGPSFRRSNFKSSGLLARSIDLSRLCQ